MSKSTLILVLILIGISGVLLWIAIAPHKNTAPTPPISITQAPPTPTPAPKLTDLTFVPNPLILTENSGSINVNIDTKNEVTAVQLELSFDPAVLKNIQIKEGSMFQNPIVLINNVDAQTGRISYAIAISPSETPKSGKGTIAVINFETSLLSGQKTEISVLPKTLATAKGVRESVLNQISGAVIERK